VTHVIDAHALLWFLEQNPKLGTSAKAVLESPHSVLRVPAIALAEACWVVEHRKTGIPSVDVLLASIAQDPRVSVVPVDEDLVRRCHLPTMHVISEMHDRQVVASVMRLAETGEQAALVTRDAEIASSGLVPIVW
jgi:PIN domain nuclease of toxin-antitoxin system